MEKFSLDWNGEYLEPSVSIPKDAHFRPPLTLRFLFYNRLSGKRDVITKTFSHLSSDKSGMGEKFYDTLAPFPADEMTSSQGQSPPPSPLAQKPLWFFLFFAFLGGLILNFMPCVASHRLSQALFPD